MTIASKIFPNSYRDSVLLMKMASAIRAMDGVENAEIIIATDANKAILDFNGLLTDEIKAASPNDLVVSVSAEDADKRAEAVARAEDMILHGMGDEAEQKVLYTAKSIAGALAMEPDANLAILSIPGPLVRKDAMKLLDAGVNLLIFSDNVPLEDELALKQKAAEKGLLVMGPDCGTAMIKGAALAFCNKCRTGSVGMVCASGTGLQEVACIVHNSGAGISNALGTGSNDVSDAIGGLTMLQGIDCLEDDAATKVIVIVSKPPAVATMEKLVERLQECRKPVVVNFLGRDDVHGQQGNIYYATTLEETARKALELSGFESPAAPSDDDAFAQGEIQRHQGKRRYLRGLFTGGTMGTEAVVIAKDALEGLTTNIHVPGAAPMEDIAHCAGHCIIDLGADEFTLGKPHPMIDPEMKNARLVQEGRDGEVAVILLDFVLGYGVHEDPVGATLPSIAQLREGVPEEDWPTIIASVTGTELDPQNRERQRAMLEEAGVHVCESNAQAAALALRIAAACQ